MKGCVAIDEWLGRRGEPLEPENMRYVTAPAKSCRGCLFSGQPSAVCSRAIAAAERAGFAHCERESVIYVSDTDPRQLAIPG